MFFLPEPIGSIRVRSLCTFASWDWREQPFRGQDHKGRFIVHAVKGDLEKIGAKYQNLPVGPEGANIRVERHNAELVTVAWAGWAANRIRELNLAGPIVITPLPSSKATPDKQNYRTLHLANLVAGQLGPATVLWSGVRFRVERVPVHAGGNRATVGEDMILTSAPPAGNIVLLDDCFTMGSHASALYRMLPNGRTPDFMVTAGRTAWEPPEQVMQPAEFLHSVYA